jgi:outer membrane receptor protein involved in Fe transport
VSFLLASAMAVAAFQAHAQTQPAAPAAGQAPAAAKSAPGKAAPAKAAPAKAAPAGKTVEGITVTGASQNGFRSSIDRRSYGVANDLATTTGSISDALKNIPSVEVDVQGNVSLRGDTNVTILVDGKPSAMFRGASAAQALQSMPADSIERVEVITNPSAQFSPEGSAGVINLVTKQVHRVGRSASVRANVGTGGRANVGVSGAYSSDKITLSGDLGVRKDPQRSTNTDDRAFPDPATGLTDTSHSTSRSVGPLDQWNARVSADYDLDRATRLSAELRHNTFNFDADFTEAFDGFGPSGALTQAINQIGRFGQDRSNTGGQVSYRRKFTGDDHTLAVNLSREQTIERNTNEFTDVTQTPVAPDLFQSVDGHNTLNQTQFKADYNRPMPDGGRLKTGYDLRIDDNDYNNVGLKGVSAATAGPDPTQTNLFLYKQTINAAYATYEQPFGDWTVLGGLRLEDVQLDLNQVTSHQTNNQNYFKAYPSLHLAYRFADDQQLILSYSHRVQRPQPQDLNPFRFVGPFSAREGNPNLQPQQTDSFEAGYQYRSGGTFYLGTLYYRNNEHGVTDVVSEIGNGVLLTTKANLASSRAAGLELVANGKLTKTLSYNLSTNLYWNEIDASGIPLGPGLGFGTTRSAFAVGGRASLNWQATPKDLFQINIQDNAKRLLPQGFAEPMVLTFLGYRHKFSESLSAVVTIQDPLDSYRFERIIESPALKERTVGRGSIQAAFVGLSWSYGAFTKRPQTFDFGGAPQP